MPKKPKSKSERLMRQGMRNASGWGSAARRSKTKEEREGYARLAAGSRRAVRDDLSNTMPKPSNVGGNPNTKKRLKFEKRKPFVKINTK